MRPTYKVLEFVDNSHELIKQPATFISIKVSGDINLSSIIYYTLSKPFGTEIFKQYYLFVY